MIWESHLWKVDLAKRAAWLRIKTKQSRWPEVSCVKVEQCVMVGCYCIRKLMDARKLTDKVASRQVPVIAYKPLGKTVHSMNWHNLDKLYDLQRPTKNTKPLRFVCNQLIHSFVFVPGFSDTGGLDFVMFCSDDWRNKNLFQLSIAELTKTFALVAGDEAPKGSFEWNDHRQDYERHARGRESDGRSARGRLRTR